jgi:predicted MFS family arabinose efflux permease
MRGGAAQCYTSPMFDAIVARLRHSDVNYRLLIPLLASSAAVQAVTAIMRVTTSYRILELGLPVVWLGIVSATYAVLPVFLAVWLGRFVDRGHDALATWIGSAVMAVACAGLWASGGSTASLLVSNALLGVGQLFAVISQQMLCVRCSRLRSREAVFGNYMVAGAVGQGIGPLIVGWAGGDATVPPTQFLFAIGFFASIVALACVVAIRPSRRRGKPQGGKEVTPLRQLLRTPGLAATMVASVIAVTAGDLIVIYLPLLGAERSIDVNAIGGLLTTRAAASMAARLIYVRLIAACGRVALMVASLVLGGVAYAALAIPMPVAALYAATAMTGFGIGIATTITITSVVALTAAGARGTANSLRVTGNRIAQAAMPFGASLVAAATGAGGIFVIIAVSLLASSAAVYWSRPQK